MDLKSQEKQSPYFKLNGWTDFQVQNLGLIRERNKATTAGKDSLKKMFMPEQPETREISLKRYKPETTFKVHWDYASNTLHRRLTQH